MRPRLTASSITSWRRSRDRVTLRSSASRNACTLLSLRVAEPLADDVFAVVPLFLVDPVFAFAILSSFARPLGETYSQSRERAAFPIPR
jgi:hypothetical protein